MSFQSIFISGFEGKTRTIHIETSKFQKCKISELKTKVKTSTGVDVDKQRLLFGSKDLEDKRGDKVMTFEDYGIRAGASITLVTRLPGGNFDIFII